MSRALALLLGMWLWAAGSAQAVVQTIHDLGVLDFDRATTFPLFGMVPRGVDDWEDIYAYGFSALPGPEGLAHTVGASVTSLWFIQGFADQFDITASISVWNGNKYVPVTSHHGKSAFTTASVSLFPPGGYIGDIPNDRPFAVVISGHSSPHNILSYGGTMTVPEPAGALLLLAGLGIVVAFARKRIA